MGDIELEGVPPHEVDDDSSPFKKSVAVIAALVLLLGAIVAFLKDDATAAENRHATEAQSRAVEAHGRQLAGNTTWETVQKRATDHRILQARGFEARRSGDDERATALLAAADEISEGSTFLSLPEYASDPYSPSRFLADAYYEASRSEYSRQAAAESADSWATRADAYGAILTLLAAALFLLGLSLIARVGRQVFLVVGLLIAAAGLVLTAREAGRDAPVTPAAAIDALAEGQRLAVRGEYEQAITAYTEAIDLRRDFALAYQGRASARWQLAANADPREPYVAYIEGADLELTIEDARAAVGNGAGDPITLNLLAALLIHDEQYARAEVILTRIIEVDDSLAVVWTNLGATRVGQGDAEGASAAYARAIELGANEPSSYHRQSLDASTRAVLEEIGARRPAHRELATQMSTAITVAQLHAVLEPPSDEPRGAVGDAGLSVVRNGVQLVANLPNSFPADTPAAFVWYRRTGPSSLWVQPTAMATFVPLTGTGRDEVRTSMGNCPVPGDYRVDVVVGSEVVATSAITVAQSPAGAPMFEEDLLAGASICRPSDWQRVEEESELVLTDAGSGTTVRVFAERREPPGAGEGAGELDSFLAGHLDSSYEPHQPAGDIVLGGLVGRFELWRSSNDNIGLVFAASDGDLVRMVVAETPPAMATMVDEVLFTMRFLGVAP